MIGNNLGDVIRIARLAEHNQRVRKLRLRVNSGHHDDRDAACQRIRCKVLKDRAAVDKWQIQIQENQGRTAFFDGPQRRETVTSPYARDSTQGERRRIKMRELRIVLYNENPGAGEGHRGVS